VAGISSTSAATNLSNQSPTFSTPTMPIPTCTPGLAGFPCAK
jgi:hypothetical protein